MPGFWRDLDLDRYVEFLGKVPQGDLPAYFAACDVMAMPSKSESRWEGLGLVYLEANYYGRATVGGNEGGVPEAVSDGETGVVVDPRNAESVARGIIRLLADKESREAMGKRGRERVHSYFNSGRMARQTLDVLEQHTAESGVSGGTMQTVTKAIRLTSAWVTGKLRSKLRSSFRIGTNKN